MWCLDSGHIIDISLGYCGYWCPGPITIRSIFGHFPHFVGVNTSFISPDLHYEKIVEILVKHFSLYSISICQKVCYSRFPIFVDEKNVKFATHVLIQWHSKKSGFEGMYYLYLRTRNIYQLWYFCEGHGNWGPANKGPPVIPKILKYKILSTKYRIKGMLAWHLSGNLELMG